MNCPSDQMDLATDTPPNAGRVYVCVQSTQNSAQDGPCVRSRNDLGKFKDIDIGPGYPFKMA